MVRAPSLSGRPHRVRTVSRTDDPIALPVRRVMPEHGVKPDVRQWPMTIPAVRQIVTDGLELGRATILVGANGSGKSTLIGAIAACYGLNPEGGSTGARFSTAATESPLAESLRLVRGIAAPRWGYFIRAETMHGLFSYLGERDAHFHRLSHGEAFLTMLMDRRFEKDGFYVLDEPEAGLSYPTQLKLLAELIAITEREKSQLLIATHSPVIAALPGARLVQLDDSGMRETSWREVDSVADYRRFLADPDSVLRHLRD